MGVVFFPSLPFMGIVLFPSFWLGNAFGGGAVHPLRRPPCFSLYLPPPLLYLSSPLFFSLFFLPPLLSHLLLLLSFSLLCAMGPSRSLRIGDDPSADAGSKRVRDAPVRLTAVGPQNAPEAPPLPLGKGKKKINLIKYPKGSDFLKSAIRHAVKVGPSTIGPSYESVFAELYRPLPGVRIWSPDVLTFYAAFVPGMVCFFEVAFDNGLCFPLHPFIKEVLQHFNICPSQLTPNGWGILVGLLAFFRDKGLAFLWAG